MENLKQSSYTVPTPIQSQAIPIMLQVCIWITYIVIAFINNFSIWVEKTNICLRPNWFWQNSSILGTYHSPFE